MSRITAVDPKQAQGKLAELLAEVNKMLGATPNMFRVAAQAPAALESLVSLFGATAHGVLRPRVRESIALAVAEANHCDYCLSAHSALGKGAGMTAHELERARRGEAADAKTQALLQFSRALVLSRGQVPPSALSELRAAGVTDTEALEVITHVALNIFTNYLNLVAGTEIDFPVVRAQMDASQAA